MLDFADADPDAGIDVAGIEHRNDEIEPIVRRIVERFPRIEVAAAGAADIAARAELPGEVGADDPGQGGAVLQRGGVVVELDEAREALPQLRQRLLDAGDAVGA